MVDQNYNKTNLFQEFGIEKRGIQTYGSRSFENLKIKFFLLIF